MGIRLKLIESWVKSDNLDIISPQLYTWGGEEEPEFDSTWPCDNCTFNKYKGSKAQFMPSLVNGEHMKAIKKYFDKLKIPVSGYFQWQPVLSASDQVKARVRRGPIAGRAGHQGGPGRWVAHRRGGQGRHEGVQGDAREGLGGGCQVGALAVCHVVE